MSKKVYIVLTNTGTLLSKAIGMYTRENLNHVSIAFDEQLTELYSFGRKQRHNPFIGGFVQENAEMGLFADAECAVYKLTVTNAEYEVMRNKIRQIEQAKKLYKYNFIGLFAVAFNKKLERERAFFCSQFVAMVVNESGIRMFEVPPSLVQPHHFSKITYLQLVYSGSLQLYLQNIRGAAYRAKAKENIWQHVRSRMFV